MKRDEPIDPNWLVDAVREFDEEMAKKPPYTGYSPFLAASPRHRDDVQPQK